jgi:hypothetical protein
MFGDNTMDSTWTPPGVHGIYVFHVDSTWNLWGRVKYTSKGPKFALHQWNMRPTLDSNVYSFIKMTDNGELLDPMLQKHALIFAVSSSLVDISSLAKCQSGKFPTVKFKSEEGKLEIVASTTP